MPLPDDQTSMPEATEHATDAIERVPPSENRRSVRSGQRQSLLQQKHTDSLDKSGSYSRVNAQASNSKLAWRQLIQLREENKRLHCELNAFQTQFEQELAAVRSGHQQEVEQYQNHLRDLMEECNHLQEAQRHLEQRYQELHHTFQEAVEDEAHKMVTEAANTVVLSPEHTPVLLRDLKKTIELQTRQVNDQHVAQTLYLMREAQRKAQQMEQELDQERQQLATERQNLLTLQNSLREQAKLRFAIQQAHLQARWAAALATTVTAIVLVLIFLQWLAYQALGLPILAAFLLPVFICFILTLLAARLWASYKHFHHSTPHKASHKPNK